MGKSATTRARLQREALRLFADRGYDETTVADIAAAAGVTQMTFFRYFPAKELVVVDDPYDPAIAHSVAAQATDLPVVERVRRGLLAAWEQLEDADDAEFRLRLRIGAGHRGTAGPDAGEQRTDGGSNRGRVDGRGACRRSRQWLPRLR